MGASFFRANLGSRIVWFSAILIFAGGLIVLLLWKSLAERFFPTLVPIEDVLWTSTENAKIFFGPRTPPSTQLAQQLRRLAKEGYYQGLFLFPDRPLYISPMLLTRNGQPNDILIFSPFTIDAAQNIIRQSSKNDPTNIHDFLASRIDQLTSSTSLMWKCIIYRRSGDNGIFLVPKDVARFLESHPKSVLLSVLGSLQQERSGGALSIINVWIRIVSQGLCSQPDLSVPIGIPPTRFVVYVARMGTEYKDLFHRKSESK